MPHKTDSNYIYHAKWDDEKKQNARFDSIIRSYQKFWKRSSIPIDRQYWTLCGAHYNKEGKLKGELGHVLENGLIQPEQFFGIDHNSQIIGGNKTHYPHIKWILGDFIEILYSYVKKNNFNPAIINYDGTMMSKFSSKYLKKIFTLIDYNVPKSLLLSTTFMLNNSYNPTIKNIPQDPIEFVKKEYWIADHWIPLKNMIYYSISDHTNVVVIIWIKRDHDTKNIKVTSGRQFDDWIEEGGIMT